MRIIFYLLMAFLIAQPVLSQDKPPSKMEMEAQIQQLKKEAQQQVNDLENQIAEAKRNKEDPQIIKELEKQLAI